jgi:hypothetical protein
MLHSRKRYGWRLARPKRANQPHSSNPLAPLALQSSHNLRPTVGIQAFFVPQNNP